MKVLELSKQDIALSVAEAEAVCKVSGKLFDNYLIVDCLSDCLESSKSIKDSLVDVLAYTKSVGSFGFLLSRPVVVSDIAGFITGSYGFSFVDCDDQTKSSLLKLTTLIDHPVDLKNPVTRLCFVHYGDQTLCIVNATSNVQKFEDRRAHLRPLLHPSSLHPRLARCFVNLTGISSGLLFDPFCGSGGILIEAGLRGLDIEGSDISPSMIERSRVNCKHYGVDSSLKVQDALKIVKKYDYIATDIAYGKSTISEGDLITHFLEHLPSILRKRAVIGLPSTYDEKVVLDKLSKELKVINTFSYYLHKSLSKKIIVVERV